MNRPIEKDTVELFASISVDEIAARAQNVSNNYGDWDYTKCKLLQGGGNA